MELPVPTDLPPIVAAKNKNRAKHSFGDFLAKNEVNHILAS